ncbi:hypothetical protein J5J10_04890 [Ciceribacter sp. L1K23]|uniref:hypothetical protein n=1 Tax=Ciceribacter sp. L1K23 TaxID=2820276 RepID=UPI001B832030|nr:hypothetical protein [Ciceribacter sp. L1K23]MBR0555011.1 hypothetical protein [Ciceribacter sp. L1K23]
MSFEPRHRFFDTLLSEWIERVPNELDVDAVGLWQIVGSGRDGFSLQGKELADFVNGCVLALLRNGAVPVRPSAQPNEFWRRDIRYEGCDEEIALSIVNEWTMSGSDPDHDGLWFFRFHSAGMQYRRQLTIKQDQKTEMVGPEGGTAVYTQKP